MISRSLSSIALVALVSLFASEAFASEEVNITDAPTEANHFDFTEITAYRETLGQFSPTGVYQSNPNGSSVWNLANIFNVDYRIGHSWEVGTSFSLRNSQATYPTGTASSVSFGNPTLNGTYHFNFLDHTHAMVHAGLSFPWHFRDTHVVGDPESGNSAAEDLASGLMSGFGMNVGAGVIRRIPEWKLRLGLDCSVSIPFSQQSYLDQDPTMPITILRGRSISLNEGAAYLFNPQWSTNFGFRQLWSGDTDMNGTDELGTAGRLFTSKLGVSYQPAPAWRLSGNFETSFPFYSYAANQGYSPALSVAMSYSGI